MTRVTIDLDVLRATMPKHPTWPTGYDTTDDTEREECWRTMSRWLETGLCGATTPPEPETGTQRHWPTPTPDMHESELDCHLAPCLRGCSPTAFGCSDHPGGAQEYRAAASWAARELTK